MGVRRFSFPPKAIIGGLNSSHRRRQFVSPFSLFPRSHLFDSQEKAKIRLDGFFAAAAACEPKQVPGQEGSYCHCLYCPSFPFLFFLLFPF